MKRLHSKRMAEQEDFKGESVCGKGLIFPSLFLNISFSDRPKPSLVILIKVGNG